MEIENDIELIIKVILPPESAMNLLTQLHHPTNYLEHFSSYEDYDEFNIKGFKCFLLILSNDTNKYIFFLFDIHGNIMGYSTVIISNLEPMISDPPKKLEKLYKESKLKMTTVLWISIHPAFQGNGFGRLLLKYVILFCSTKGIVIVLDNDSDYKDFYTKEGFVYKHPMQANGNPSDPEMYLDIIHYTRQQKQEYLDRLKYSLTNTYGYNK
jgi:GNAT superfamily N-acetyltransferase